MCVCVCVCVCSNSKFFTHLQKYFFDIIPNSLGHVCTLLESSPGDLHFRSSVFLVEVLTLFSSLCVYTLMKNRIKTPFMFQFIQD